MNDIVKYINFRLGLHRRKPQADSLEILSDIAEVLTLKKNPDIEDSALKIKQLGDTYQEVKKFSEFEREFPNICFSLATGVGKTRLMGAFITYLHLSKKINNFFVLAPNLTIYNKLIDDFGTPSHPKYVFKGIAEFAAMPPRVITGETYNRIQNISTQKGIFKQVTINIFNISKINSESRGGSEPKIKRLSEYLGESYFNYLSELEDLVLLMDESHHYRADAGMRVINELNPILGLEVTATPQVERSGRSIKFKNVVYEYSLAKAIKDGFVKEPSVATRRNFDPSQYKDEELDRIKLEDGIRIHEDTLNELELYAKNYKKPIVKPFVLVVAKDTKHAEWIETLIKSPNFFDGYYANKVIQVHSAQSGSEKEENIQRLLNLENPHNKIEIVIHVNMLKEGWDVTNLYTIIPLRTATSMTLREQTIGRGLRLPYGERTGDPKVDKLTIVAHDKFQQIIEEANKENSIIRQENVIEINLEELKQKKEVVTSISNVERKFAEEEKHIAAIEDNEEKKQAVIKLEAKKAVYETLPALAKTGKNLSELTLQEVKHIALENKKQEIAQKSQLGLFDTHEIAKIQKAIEEVAEEIFEDFKQNIIEIPRIIIQPTGEVKAGFNDFELDTTILEENKFRPVSEEILRKTLRENQEDIITGKGRIVNDRLDNIIVNELINISEVYYDRDADLLFKIANQLLDRLKLLSKSEDELINVVQYHKREIAAFIKPQLMQNFYCEVVSYEKPKVYPFDKILEHNFAKYSADNLYNFRATVESASLIPAKVFEGFTKACHSMYKFDSKTEKDLAVILEDDKNVLKWLRPARDQFKIYWNHNSSRYEPDFVVETHSEIYMVETKKDKEVSSAEVQEKARAAQEYCRHASDYTTQNNGKPWKYILIPHNIVMYNMSFDHLVNNYEYKEI